MTRQTVSNPSEAPDGKTVVAGPRGGMSYDPSLNSQNQNKPRSDGIVVFTISGDDVLVYILKTRNGYTARDYSKTRKSRQFISDIKSKCSNKHDIFKHLPSIADSNNLRHIP